MSQPLVPSDVDLRDFAYMPLDVLRLRDSDLAAEATDAEFRAAVMLWCASWHQLPAASLPDNDAILTRLAGFGRDIEGWKSVREGALRNWIRCNDGRLYHPVVAEKANEAWDQRVDYRKRLAAARAAKAAKAAAAKPPYAVSSIIDTVIECEASPMTGLKGTERNGTDTTSLNREANDKRSSPKRVRTRQNYSEKFEEFWKAYPTDANMSKQEAFVEWTRLSPEDRDAAIVSCQAFRRYCASNADYRPIHACRYLAKRRFDGHNQTAISVAQTVFVRIGTPQWDSWERWYRRTKNMSPPTNKEGTGWNFPFEWPADMPARVGA